MEDPFAGMNAQESIRLMITTAKIIVENPPGDSTSLAREKLAHEYARRASENPTFPRTIQRRYARAIARSANAATYPREITEIIFGHADEV